VLASVYLSTAYLAPIQYYSKFILADEVFIESFENFTKQTYRTRCDILGANGRLILSIPVEKAHGDKMPVKEVRIDYRTDWQRIHWQSLVSAYNSSPFFMYYADDLFPFYQKKEPFLFDFNLKLIQKICELVGIDANKISLTEKFEKEIEYDYRQSISPKFSQQREDTLFYAKPYYQIFAEKFGFTPNLSIVDLLFNEGTEAISVLKQSVRTSTQM
jgi:hypothetical protein